MLRVNDTVTYAKTRETQSVEPARRNARGVVKELDFIDGENCAKVEWEWTPGVGCWIHCRRLEKSES